MLLTMLCLLLRLSHALLSGETPALGGTNVIITSDGNVSYEESEVLPYLQPETRITSYGAVANDAFDGIIQIGATLSLDPDNKFYAYGKAVRRSLQMFLDLVNYDFGGLNVSGQRYGMRFTWVGDGGNSLQVSNATAHASRLTEADFLFAGYASGYTTHAVKQSYAEGKLIMCGGAATPSVYSQNNLSFGFFPPGGTYTKNAVLAIAEAAVALDGNGTTGCGLEPAEGAAPRSCVGSILVGFLQADASFTTTMCAGAPEHVLAAGLQLAPGNLTVTVPSSPTADEMAAALATLQAANVTVIVGCTYYATGVAMLDGLEALDYSPLATTMSSTLDTDSFASLVVDDGWWQGEYAIGYATWHRSSTTRGAFSNMTSEEFASAFAARYDGVSVPYQGTSQFAAAVALADAIQTAGTLETHAVAAALRAQDLREFYGQLSYDEHGQLQGDMVVLQWLPSSATVSLVYPSRLATGSLAFPTPPWALRRCRALSLGEAGQECHGRGACTTSGTCDCDEAFGGDYCEKRLSGVPVVRLGGLFPFYSSAEAAAQDAPGLARVAAFVLAIAEINEKADGVADELLPNTRLEFALADSRRDEATATQGAIALLGSFGGDGVSAMVGASRSDCSIATAQLTAPNMVPQLSPASTSPALSGGTEFFARTPPSDAFQAAAMADVLAFLWGATKAAVVASTDAYGSALLEAFRTEAALAAIEIVTEQTFAPGAAAADGAVVDALRRSGARYVVLLCSASDGADVLHAAWARGVVGSGFVWLGSDAATGSAVASHLPNGVAADVLPGYFFLAPNPGTGSEAHQAFLQRLNASLPAPTAGADAEACSAAVDDEGKLIWSHELVAGEPPDCTWPSLATAAADSYSAYTYDAAYALAHALHELIETRGVTAIDGAELMGALVADVSFDGLSGTVEFYNNAGGVYHGDRRTGVQYDLLNVQSADAPEGLVVGSWTPCVGYCVAADKWAMSWSAAAGANLTFAGGGDAAPDADALPPCSSRDAVGACVFSADDRAVAFAWLVPTACEGGYEAPADHNAAAAALCPLSDDTSVEGELGAGFSFRYHLRYEGGESVGTASSSLSLADNNATLVAELECDGDAGPAAAPGACSFELEHLGSLSLGLTATDDYGQSYELAGLLGFVGVACPATYYLDLQGGCSLCGDLEGVDPACPSDTSVATLPLLPGFWRLSSATTDIRACDGAVACLGGASALDEFGSGYCGADNRGPLCTLCVDESLYYSSVDALCTTCPSSSTAAGRFVAALVTILVLLVVVGGYQQLSKELVRCGVAPVVRLLVSFSWLAHAVANLRLGAKFKLLISFAQVFSMVPAVYEVELPAGYEGLLGLFDVLNFDLDLLLPRQCVSREPAAILTAYALTPFLIVAIILVLGLISFASKRLQLRAARARLGVTTAERSAVSPSATPAEQEGATGPVGDRSSYGGRSSAGSTLSQVGLEEAVQSLEGALANLWSLVLNLELFVLFCFAPSVSRMVFSSWGCDTYAYDDATAGSRSFLRLDPSVRCSDESHTSEAHGALTSLSVGFVVLWPVAVPALWLALLLLSRRAIMAHTPTMLSRSTKFLWADYEPAWCFWEVVELLRKIALTGFVMLIPNETIMKRTLVGLVLSLAYTLTMLGVKPHRDNLENKIALASAVVTNVVLFAALLMKLCDLSAETCTSLGFASAYQVSLAFMGSAIAILASILAAVVHRAYFSDTYHTLLLQSTRREPELTLARKLRWHGFVSHYWNSAQDLAALVKRQLTALMPLVRIFLDVDDLQSIDDLELYIEQSALIVCILSKGYFLSANCMREVRHGLKRRKCFALVHESDPTHGGAPLKTLIEQCPEDLREPIFLMSEEMDDAPGRPVTPWHRVKDFQLVSLKAVAQQVLLATPTYSLSKEDDLAMYVPGEVASQRLSFARVGQQRGVRLAYSKDNPGAEEVANELASCLRFVGGGVAAVKIEACRAFERRGLLGMLSRRGSSRGPSSRKQSKLAISNVTVDLSPRSPISPGLAITDSNVVASTTDDSNVNPLPPLPEHASKLSRHGSRRQSGVLRNRERFGDDSLAMSNVESLTVSSATIDVPTPRDGGGVDDDAAEAAAERTEPAATHALLYLNNRTFVGAEGKRLAETMREVLGEGHLKLLLVHELDDDQGGCEFGRFFDTTPRDLIVDGIYKTLATGLAPGMHRPVSIALIAKALGGRKDNRRGGSVMQAFEADKKKCVGGTAKDLLAAMSVKRSAP